MARLYDATITLEDGMLCFPGDPSFELRQVFKTSAGDAFNLSALRMGTHTGTHIDPPAHYLIGGKPVDQLPLEALIGPGIVLDLRKQPCIDRRALEKAGHQEEKRILLKTDNGPKLHSREFEQDYVHLTEDGAAYLVEKDVCLVGIDYLSIERYENKGAPVHCMLLSAGVIVLEAVDLLHVPLGPCYVYCLPLRIRGGDGAPARVVIRKDNS